MKAVCRPAPLARARMQQYQRRSASAPLPRDRPRGGGAYLSQVRALQTPPFRSLLPLYRNHQYLSYLLIMLLKKGGENERGSGRVHIRASLHACAVRIPASFLRSIGLGLKVYGYRCSFLKRTSKLSGTFCNWILLSGEVPRFSHHHCTDILLGNEFC